MEMSAKNMTAGHQATCNGFLPFPALSFQSLGLFAAILLVFGYLVRRALLPKPIPGIPYRKANAEKLFGNGLEVLAWQKEHGEMLGYFAKMAVDLNTPIFQAFVHPFGKPWVVIADHREANDIMARRTNNREFDRSRFMGDILSSLSPEFHFHMPTGDKWKAHRKLVADTMSPAFLSEVAGPQMWKSTMKLIELWQIKEQLAQGRPFAVMEDLRKAAYEIIWTATFGFEPGAMKVQSDLLLSLPKSQTLPHMDQAIDFPAATDPEIFKAGLALNDALQEGIRSLSPRLHLFLAYNAVPSLRAARSLKDRVIEDLIKQAIDKFSTKTDVQWEDQSNVRRYMKSATDMVIARELQSARKEGRAPEPLSRIIQDELFSFLLAGNEVYTFVSWTLKFLTAHQDVQTRLRQELIDQLSQPSDEKGAAAGAGAVPSASEIGTARLPYLDAVMEESLRCGQITQSNIRTTQRDVVIFGHHIPKGTEVLMLNNGPSVLMPPLHVDEALRSDTSRGAADKVGDWNVNDMRDFNPSRWLIEDSQGQISFNPSAGPRNSFGAGPQACFVCSPPPPPPLTH